MIEFNFRNFLKIVIIRGFGKISEGNLTETMVIWLRGLASHQFAGASRRGVMIKYPNGKEMKNTPYIIITSWFPAHKEPEVTKRYIEVMKKYPEDEELSEHVVPVAVTTGKYGIKTMDIYKVKQGKLEEHLTRSTMAMAMFHSIEGFVYSIRVWLTIEEALAAVGQ